MSQGFPFLTTIGFVITLQCPIACSHCALQAGPQRKEKMNIKNVRLWLKEITNYNSNRIKALSITGGEPFLEMDLLKEICSIASSVGIVIVISTNAFWATSLKTAQNKLKSLQGLRAISISFDQFHSKFINIDNIRNAVEAALSQNIAYRIIITTNSFDSRDYQSIFKKLNNFAQPKSIISSIIYNSGRAHSNDFSFRKNANPCLGICRMAASPMIFPNGKVFGCVGPIVNSNINHPMFLGNLKNTSLKEILDKTEKNYVLHALRVFGPAYLINEAQKNKKNTWISSDYIENNLCETCQSIISNKKAQLFLSELANQELFQNIVTEKRYDYWGAADFICYNNVKK